MDKGKLSAERLEREIEERQGTKLSLEAELDGIQEQIQVESTAQIDASLILQALSSFQDTFSALSPPDQAEALLLLLKEIRVYPDRLVMEVFKLPEFVTRGGSKNRQEWLPTIHPLRNALDFARAKFARLSVNRHCAIWPLNCRGVCALDRAGSQDDPEIQRPDFGHAFNRLLKSCRPQDDSVR